MLDNIEDLFDVSVAPYFPMMFTPPKDDKYGVTRDLLLEGVINTMSCTPEFAPLAIPLLSEKLGSDYK